VAAPAARRRLRAHVGGSQRVPTNTEHTGIIIDIATTVLIIVIAIPLCR
jgi:hypothetical protein